jgi:menaquinone reductase, molybdopterin-binding-like subunit
MKRDFGRRNFLKLMAAASAGLATPACSFSRLAPAGVEEWPAGTEEWITSSCAMCEGGCGILARVVDGALVKLEGNPAHPVNRGRLCAVGHAALQLLYSPDRIRAPLKRVGGKGEDQWVKITWSEAIDSLSAFLNELRQKDEPHSLVLFHTQKRGLTRLLLERFCQSFGTPNLIDAGPVDGMKLAYHFMHGVDQSFGFDLQNSHYVLSFGCELLDGWRSPVYAARSYGQLRQERSGGPAKIIHVGRRFSVTAARADQWIPVNPGTEGSLALAIAYVLIREETYDRDFVENFTFGFHDWQDPQGRTRPGFRRLVLQKYRPDLVSELTGVPVETIIRVAKDFASNRPAIAIADENSTGYPDGTYTAMAVHALNALSGAIEVPGGVVMEDQTPFKTLDVDLDATALKGLARPPIDFDDSRPSWSGRSLESIPRNILEQTSYRVKGIILHHTNLLFDSRIGDQFQRALAEVPLVVSIASFMDESTRQADLILPDPLYLEKWVDVVAAPISGIPVVGLARPVVKPLYDTMHCGDLLLALTREVGGAVARSFPWDDFRDFLKFSLQGVFESRHGALFTDPIREAYARELQKRGWQTGEIREYDEFWEALTRQGGWWGLYHEYGRWGKAFYTPSHKFEFHSRKLETALENEADLKRKSLAAVLKELGVTASVEEAFLPNCQPPAVPAPEDAFQLYLNPFRVPVLTSAASANLPWLQEVVGRHLNVSWDSWLEINPQTARQAGISEGDWIYLESSRGRVRVRARLYPGAMPNVVNLPWGLGHRGLGRWAEGRGVNPNSLIELSNDALSATPAWFSTRVRIYKV